MKLAAIFFKILFRIPFFRKRYFGFYKRIFKPFRLFRRQTAICRYDSDLKINADLEEWIQQHIYFFGTWDEPGSRFLKSQLKPGDVFLDIGANIGSYSMVASKIVGLQGEVHAFEPVARVFSKLMQNIELNKLINISANRNAVYETSGTLELYVSSKENEGMSSIFHHDTESGEVERVEAITIDEYIEKKNLKRVDMIKIDIEGAEWFALRGMQNTINLFKPLILMEVSDDVMLNGPFKGKDIFDLMKSMNYTMKGIDREGRLVELTGISTDYTNFAFCAE